MEWKQVNDFQCRYTSLWEIHQKISLQSRDLAVIIILSGSSILRTYFRVQCACLLLTTWQKLKEFEAKGVQCHCQLNNQDEDREHL